MSDYQIHQAIGNDNLLPFSYVKYMIGMLAFCSYFRILVWQRKRASSWLQYKPNNWPDGNLGNNALH